MLSYLTCASFFFIKCKHPAAHAYAPQTLVLCIIILFPLQCATSDPDGRKRALVIGGGIANFTDVAATFNGIIRALKEKVRLNLLG